MKRRTIVPSIVALLVATANAQAFSDEQKAVIQTVARVIFAGTDGNCPRLHAINRAVTDELLSAGIAPDHQMDSMQDALSASTRRVRAQYSSNPSGFCLDTWRFAGPQGQHKRQMLESN